MTAREYLQKIVEKHGPQQVTFVIAHSVRNAAAPGHHYEYQTTPVYYTDELLRYPADTWVDKHLVINADHPPIDITGIWVRNYQKGWLYCAMLTTETDLRTLYCETQATSMIAYYEREVTL